MPNPPLPVTLTADESTLLTFLSSIPLEFRQAKWKGGWSDWASNEHKAERLSLVAFGIAHALVGASNPVQPTEQDKEMAVWFLRTGFGEKDTEFVAELRELGLQVPSQGSEEHNPTSEQPKEIR